jgi:hypothetical protein
LARRETPPGPPCLISDETARRKHKIIQAKGSEGIKEELTIYEVMAKSADNFLLKNNVDIFTILHATPLK